MPIYCYKCPDGHVTEDFCHKIGAKPRIACDVCGKYAKRNIGCEQKNTDCVYNERYSDSMGVNPDQIPVAKKTFPGSEYLSDGRLIVESRSDKLKKMKERGLMETG